MEHLGGPKNSYKPIQIPYLGGPTYDGKDFHDFPHRQGLSVNIEEALDDNDLLERINEQKWSLQQISSLIQNWLWFGSLGRILALCGIEVLSQDFLRPANAVDDSSSTIASREFKLNTERLNTCLQLAGENESKLSEESRSEHHEQVKGILGCMRKWLIDCTVGRVYNRESWDILTPPIIELSLSVLHDSLDAFRLLVYDNEEESTSFGNPSALDSNSLLARRMIEQGWCPSQVYFWRNKFPPSVIYYLSLLGSPKRLMNHDNCNDSICYTLRKDHVSYQMAHTTLDCCCDHVRIDCMSLVDILERDSYPVIAVTPSRSACGDTSFASATHSLTLKAKPWNEHTEYVAISHVWSDGLGNPVENALPYCQLQALYRMAKSLTEQRQPAGDAPVHLWIDTLCVPVQHAKARKLAIKAMRETYRNATSVLVLDAEVMKNSRNEPDVDLLMRLHMSTWERRLWTLQEGVLAKSLYFWFSDGAKNIEEMTQVLDSDSYDNCLPIPISALLFYRSMRLVSANAGLERFYNICELVFQRSTTKASDEAICLSTLMDLDLASIAEAPDTEKMKYFYWQLRTLPPDIIFASGPHMQDRGWEWAPRSFLTVRSKKDRLMFSLGDAEGEQAAVVRSIKGEIEGAWSGILLSPRSSRLLARSFGVRYGAICFEIFPSADEWVEDWETVAQPSSSTIGLITYTALNSRRLSTRGVLLTSTQQCGEGLVSGQFWCQCRVTVVGRDVGEGQFVPLHCQPVEGDPPRWWVGPEDTRSLFLDEQRSFETWTDADTFIPRRWRIT